MNKDHDIDLPRSSSYLGSPSIACLLLLPLVLYFATGSHRSSDPNMVSRQFFLSSTDSQCPHGDRSVQRVVEVGIEANRNSQPRQISSARRSTLGCLGRSLEHRKFSSSPPLSKPSALRPRDIFHLLSTDPVLELKIPAKRMLRSSSRNIRVSSRYVLPSKWRN